MNSIPTGQIKTEEELEELLASCLSEAERLTLLKKQLLSMSEELDEEKNSNDSINEKLRIKERELSVQYEENDRLNHNYSRLKKRMSKLQDDVKTKKNSKGLFSGIFGSGKEKDQDPSKKKTLLED